MYIFIVNPIAGNGKGLKMYKRVINDHRLRHIIYDTFVTEYAGHAEEITINLLQENKENKQKHWVIFGGDGTLHEVMNGIGKQSITLSYFCGGSGNDFAHGTNISFNVEQLIQDVFFQTKKEPYFLGKYDKRNFVNCVGFGFDAIVAHYTNRSKLKKHLNKLKLGNLTYIFQLVRQLLTYKPIQLEVLVDGTLHTYDRCFLLTVNNHPYLGGGMKINPTAKNKPDTYSCIVINNISKWKVLLLFGTVFTGKHTKFKEVSILQGKHIKVTSMEPVIFQADGETKKTTTCSIGDDRTTIQVVGSHMN